MKLIDILYFSKSGDVNHMAINSDSIKYIIPDKFDDDSEPIAQIVTDDGKQIRLAEYYQEFIRRMQKGGLAICY